MAAAPCVESMIERISALFMLGFISFFCAMTAHGQDIQNETLTQTHIEAHSDIWGNLMKIRIVVGGQELPATLENNASAKAFAEMLPLDIRLDDYHGIEKVSDLPGSLPTHDAPAGVDPDVGDITLYSPWGNLAIFYRDFGYSTGLVKLGRIEGNMAVLAVKGSVNARIERVE